MNQAFEEARDMDESNQVIKEMINDVRELAELKMALREFCLSKGFRVEPLGAWGERYGVFRVGASVDPVYINDRYSSCLGYIWSHEEVRKKLYAS